MIRISTPEQLFLWLRNSGMLKKYNIRKFGIFGSFARREPFRDIDLLLEDDDVNWESLVEFSREFRFATGKNLDIMVKKYAEPLVLKRALRDIQYES